LSMIKRIMLLLCISFIVPLAIMAIHLAANEYNSSVDSYVDYMTGVLENINKETTSYIDDLSARAMDMANSYEFRQYFKDTSNEEYSAMAATNLRKIADYSSQAKNVALLNLGGNMLMSAASLPVDWTPAINVLDDVRFKQKIRIDFSVFQHDSNLYFTVYAPVIINGETKGYYVQFVDTSHLEMLLSTHKSYRADEFFIIDSTDNILSPNRFVHLSEEYDVDRHDLFASKFHTIGAWSFNKLYTVEYRNFKTNEKMLALFIRDEDTNLCFVYACPNAQFSKGRTSVILIIFAYTICMALIIGFTFVKMNKKLKVAFEEIFKAIEIYEMGDWTYRPNVDEDNELGTISKSLWNLAQNLNAMYSDIKFNEYRYKLAMEFSGDLIFDYDLKSNVFETDRIKWESLFPFEYVKNEKKLSEELVSRMHPEDIDKFEKYRKQLFQACYDEIEKQFSTEFRVKLKDEQYHWIEKSDVLVKGAEDAIEHIIGTIVLIDERKNSELALTQKATMDALTGLFNRSAFISKAEKVLMREKLSTAAVIFIDLDDFKFINDTYGHEAGDDVLRFVGSVIRDVTGDSGFGGRYGGDEFLIFLKDKNIATAIAAQLLEGFAKDFAVRGTDSIIKIHSSIGIANHPDHADNIDDLIKRADDAMYYSKKNGKNRYVLYDVCKGVTNDED